MDVDIVNDTTLAAYLRFENDSTDFPLSGTFSNGTSSVPLDQFTNFTIAPGATLIGFDIQTIDSGKLLLSLGGTLSTSSGTAFQAPATGDSAEWWDKVEMTYLTNAGTVINNGNTVITPAGGVANLTAADFLGLELQVQTFVTGTAAPQTTLGWDPAITTADEFNTLASFYAGSTATADAVITGPNGVFVPQLNENVLRVISPSTLPPADQTAFAWPQNYIDYVMSNGITTQVTGTFFGTPSTTYDYVASIPTVAVTGANPGDLLLVGEGIDMGRTIDLPSSSLVVDIIGGNPGTYFVNGTTVTGNPNNADGAAIAAILGGFNYGFVGSTEGDPANGGTAFGDLATDQWYVAGNAALAFDKAQPTTGFYNQYAADLASAGDAYGFPYSDLIPGSGNPQAQLLGIDTTVITILGNNTPACFAAGTLIRTSNGELPVEHLVIGMTLPTVLGRGDATVVWLGHRVVYCRRHPNPGAVLPIRIISDAFGPGRPHRDLVLSPDHALLIDGVLIPVRCLVNGLSIVQEAADMVTYHHVELDRHDVILAAGLPVESYLDSGNRRAFANGGPAVSAHPDFDRWTWDAAGCAPLVIAGPQVERARAVLIARPRTREPDATLGESRRKTAHH